MTDPRTPSEIWQAACLAMIEQLRDWQYDIRPFVKPVPYSPPTEVSTVWKQATVKIKPDYELPGSKGATYKVLMAGNDGTSFIKNVNYNHPSQEGFWIKNEKLELTKNQTA